MNQIINNLLIGLNNVGRLFCDYAASAFVQSALLVIVLFVVDLLLRKRVRAVFRYCLWLLVLVKLVLPPTLSSPTGIGYWAGDHFPAAFHASSRMFDAAMLERTSPSGRMPPVRSSEDIASQDALTTPDVSALAPLTWRAVLLVLWLVGVSAFLALLLQRVRFVRRLVATSSRAERELLNLLQQCRRQIGVRWHITLRISDGIPSPAVCGLFRPTVLIPASLAEKLSPEALRATLIHELAHIKRGDLWVNVVQTFLQVIYFYNPLVWFANSVIRRVCEEAVDETVLVALGGQAKNYSNTLIDIGEMAFWRADLGLRLIGVAESKKALQWRIKHMLTRPIPKSSKLGALSIIVIFTIAAVLLPMARAQKVDEGSKPVATESEGKATQSLHEAAYAGDIEQVKLLISSGADVNSRDEEGRTPLHRARRIEVVQLLIEAGADVNAKDNDGATPLHVAGGARRLAVVESLISKGADITAKTQDGLSPVDAAMVSQPRWLCPPRRKAVVELFIAKGAQVSTIHLAAYVGNVQKVKEFLEQGIQVNTKGVYEKTPLHFAADQGHMDVVELLLAAGADVNAQDDGGLTPLHYAAPTGRKEVAELLIGKGADVNSKDKQGLTPFFYALTFSRTDIGRLLIEKGADVHAKDQYGYTLLHWAVLMGNIELTELVLSKGAEVNLKDGRGLTPLDSAYFSGKAMGQLLVEKGAEVSSLQSAALIGDLAKVKTFLDAGVDVNAKNAAGVTALQAGASGGCREVAEFLILKGADANASGLDRETALHSAARTGSREVVELLISKGVDVNVADRRRMTALHTAASAGNTDIVALLVAKGVDVNAKDVWIRTPLHYACSDNHRDMAELLLTKGADVNAKDQDGNAPLAGAEEAGHTEIVDLLRKHGAKE